MKYLIRKRTDFLYDFIVVPEDMSVEEKQKLNESVFGTIEYVEINSDEMYSFGCFKNELDAYKNSTEFNPSLLSTLLLPGEIEI